MTDAGPRIAVVGAGAIGGVTAVFLAEAGHAVQIVTKYAAVAAQARADGLRVRGVRGEHRAKLLGVATVGELEGPLDVVLLATKSTEDRGRDAPDRLRGLLDPGLGLAS